MRPIEISALGPEQLAALEQLYRTTRVVRLRTRVQMVLLAAEQRLTAAAIAGIVLRASEETVRRWLKRYLAEGIEGLRDVPRPGTPVKVTEEYKEGLLWAFAEGPAAWSCRSRCGRCGGWPTTWRSRPVSGSSTRPSGCI